MVMHKKCIAVVRIVRIVSGFWHNSGKLSDNSELREFSDSLVRVREGGKVREIESPQGIFRAPRVRVRVENFGIGEVKCVI